MYEVFSTYSAFPSGVPPWRALSCFRPCASQSPSSLFFLSLSVCHVSSSFSCPPRFLARPLPLRSLLSLRGLHTIRFVTLIPLIELFHFLVALWAPFGWNFAVIFNGRPSYTGSFGL